MTCPFCRVFLGHPCACCRTHSRIGFLLGLGKLVPVQEAAALKALRDCVGALQDLVEVNQVIPPPPALPVPGATSSGAGSNKLLSAKEDKTKKAEEGGPSASEVDANASKEPLIDNREKKERTKSKRKDKSVDKKAGSGEEESPKVVESKRKRRDEGATVIPARTTSPEELQEHVDTFVSKNPERFELGSLPVRGSAGRHFRDAEERVEERHRPTEPAHPPSRRHGGCWGEQPEARSQRPEKKSKGAKHRKRGRDWRQNQGRRRRR